MLIVRQCTRRQLHATSPSLLDHRGVQLATESQLVFKCLLSCNCTGVVVRCWSKPAPLCGAAARRVFSCNPQRCKQQQADTPTPKLHAHHTLQPHHHTLAAAASSSIVHHQPAAALKRPLHQLQQHMAAAAAAAPAAAAPGSSEELPLIDISPLYDPASSADAKQHVAAQIRKACLDTGFFYVTGHGVDAAPLLRCGERLFSLPPADKQALDAAASPLHRGFTALGGSHNCVPQEAALLGPDNKESFLLGAEGSASPMHGDNTWPPEQLLPGWQATVRASFGELLALSRVVARGLALSLGLPEAFFDACMTDPVAQLLLLRYPPPPHAAAANGSSSQQEQERQQPQYVGCGSHTDCGFLTILAQDDVPGLQVKMASGRWITAPTIPGALLVNLGDMTARWTNDLYKSTEHRVFNTSSKARYSAPFFCNCDFDAVVEPAAMAAAAAVPVGGAGSDSSSGEAPAAAAAAKYEPIKAGHYIMQKLGLMWQDDASTKA